MSEEEQLLALLRERGLVIGHRSKWGQPALRTIEQGHEPQPLMEASALQRRFVACAHGTPSPGSDLCASWVEQSFSRLGLGVVLGDASELYAGYCHYTDTADLKVGMVVAVPAHPYSPQGLRHGHVGIYAGDGMVMDAVAERVRKIDLGLWLSAYGLMATPRWGWLGSMGLQ
ncbi:MAG: hypothetical protein IKF78_02835 [Atopobiaceae bacterium]|nr:hypothetical protein [Atopobiaceae bacterium]